MKIRRERLKAIIKEELNNVLQEWKWPWEDDEPEEPGAMHDGYEVGTFTPDDDPMTDNRSMTGGEYQSEQYDDHIRDQVRKQERWEKVNSGDGASMRRAVNAMLKAGEIDKNTWRRARRALYKSNGVDRAKQIVRAARQSADPGFAGGYADLASNPAAAAYELE